MSSVIIEKSTGKVICELCNPRAISKVNQDKYRIVPVGEYLARINKELEQALKGEQYEEHRKKAEAAISNGASLTSHRIEL